MPLDAVPTTIPLLQDAFRATLEGTTPRTQRGADNEWKYYSRPHNGVIGTRWFRFEWDNEGLADGGVFYNTGAAIELTMSIIVDYGGVPVQEVDAMAHDDHQQIVDVLDRLRITVDGLRRVLSFDWSIDDDTENDQAQVVHEFVVRYLQAKAA